MISFCRNRHLVHRPWRRWKILLLLGVCLISVVSYGSDSPEQRVISEKAEWVIDSASFDYDKDLTGRQMIDSATQIAIDKILDRGVLLFWRTQANLIIQGDITKGELLESEASYEFKRPRTKLQDFEVLREFEVIDTIAGRPGAQPRLVRRIAVVVTALIATDSTRPDPGFRMEAKLNPRVFREFEVMPFTVESTQDCYLTIFVMESDGSMSLVFPDEPQTDNFISANQRVPIPAADAGWVIEARLREGQTHSREMAIAVATKKRLPFLPQGDTANSFGFLSVNSGLQEFVRWIGRIPSDQMVQVGLPYDIFEK